MLSERGHIVLTDFGSAKMLQVSEKTRTIAGTPQYIAPEVLRGEPYSFSADWWSCGILLYEMLTGKVSDLWPGDVCIIALSPPPIPLLLSFSPPYSSASFFLLFLFFCFFLSLLILLSPSLLLFSLKTPFFAVDRVELYKLVLRGYFTVPKSVSPRARSLMYKVTITLWTTPTIRPHPLSLSPKLINKDQESRIGCSCGACQYHSAADIKQNSFFSKVRLLLKLECLESALEKHWNITSLA